MVGNNEEIDIDREDAERERDEIEIFEKLKILNVKKGDVLVVKYMDIISLIAKHPHMDGKMPPNVYHKLIEKQLKEVKKFIKENYGGQVGMIAIPDSVDLEIIRLEEWFV